MPYSEAKALFKESNVTFGRKSNADDNETTFDKIRNSGAVFIPLTAWRPSGQSVLKQWGKHGNYTTTSRNRVKNILHVRITPSFGPIIFNDGSDSNQGCATRLVQNY